MSTTSANLPAGTDGVPPLRRWAFGDAVLDERTLELRVRGELAELERKPLEVLIYLLEHAGEAVTKDELAENLWPGRILTETVLTRCVSLLRQVLRDDAREIIKTVHGYGYRLLVPVSVEILSCAVPPARFDFQPGEKVPLRPLWRFEKRLGTGGHGEVWLARQEKTRAARVYKYATEGASLTALKREITIYRLLHDSLGERPDLVRIIDWNLQEPPYFIESEYTAGGDLETWAQTQGGLAGVPLALRLECLVQIAEVLAAAHAVGVLHKDLKPANVLVEPRAGLAPQIKLGDFGSGGVLDPRRLDALRITRLGFTQTTAAGQITSGTPLYLAPEVAAGQPLTLQADIYALGVILYQLVLGDLRRPLAPGWERDIADELLREDIAAAADGNPQRRLADAATLAERLRSLDRRREQRAQERAAHAAAERSRQMVERLRARRSWMFAAMAALGLGLAASLALYLDTRRAWKQAEIAAATTRAVNEFLNQDLLASADLNQRGTRDLSMTELLDRAAKQADQRFADQPEAAAQLHASIGSSYGNLGLFDAARTQFEKAAALDESLHGRDAESTQEALHQLAGLADLQGRHVQAMALYEETLSVRQRRYGSQDPKATELLPEAAWAIFNGGAYRRAVELLSRYIEQAQAAPKPDARALAGARSRLGSFLDKLGDYPAAEQVTRRAIAEQTATVGARYMETAVSRIILGGILTDSGRYAEADAELLAAREIIQTLVAAGDPFMGTLNTYLGRLRVEQDRVVEGAAILELALKLRQASFGPEAAVVAWNRYLLAEAYQRIGRLPEAAGAAAAALAVSDKADGPEHPCSLQIRIGYAGILREQGEHARAREVLQAISAAGVAGLPPQHPFLANLRREEGLQALLERRYDRARPALAESLQIAERRYGATHWRTARARTELAQVPST